MNDLREIEDRFRDAAHAYAGGVEPAPDAWERLGRRTRAASRRRRAIWIGGTSALAAAALVAGVLLVADDDPTHRVKTRPAGSGTTSTTATVVTDIKAIPRGSTAELPPAPGGARVGPALVWSGTEMIVWGGNDDRKEFGDGAAFDPDTGTWRVITPAPIEARLLPQAVWTGTEMIVMGGFQERGLQHVDLRDGAAYNPTTDTWRRLPDAAIVLGDGLVPVWTGAEVIVLGDGAAAYSPETNEWRRLADPPKGSSFRMVWTGETILMTVITGVVGSAPDYPSSLVRYDLRADAWQTVDNVRYASLIAVPSADGAVGSVLALPDKTGAPVVVLDRAGNAIGTLAALPGDRAKLGDRIVSFSGTHGPGGMWVGEEALFWIRRADMSRQGTPEAWALKPEAQTWRRVDANASLGLAELVLADDAGVLIGWGSRDGLDPPTGVAYRMP